MLPTLKMGQDVLVWCWFYKRSLKTKFLSKLSNFVYTPKKGDIVAIKVNGKEMIKRIHLSSDPPAGEAGRGTFVIGDNQEESIDSRKFGPIKRSQIIGKVIWY